MKNTRTLFVILLSLLVSPLSAQAAFDFLKDFQGNIKSLDEYTGNGKWTVVMMWAHDCVVCNREAGAYVAFHRKHKDKDKDAIIVGISMDGKENKAKAEAFIKRNKLNFDNLYGQPVALAESFQQLTGVEWYGTPTFLFFNPRGELLAQQVGAVPTQMIEDFMAKNP